MFPCAVGVTRTPFPSAVGIWKIVELTKPRSVLSRRTYSPRLGTRVNFSGLIMLLILSAYTPAALTTDLASIVPHDVSTLNMLPSFSIFLTSHPSFAEAPFAWAFSQKAYVRENGHMIPLVGKNRADTASVLRLGSLLSISSFERTSIPGTPFATPCFLNASSCGNSSSENATTIAPFWTKS